MCDVEACEISCPLMLPNLHTLCITNPDTKENGSSLAQIAVKLSNKDWPVFTAPILLSV